MLTRRKFIALGAVSGLAACTQPEAAITTPVEPVAPVYPPLPEFYGAITDEPFPIPAVEEGSLAPEYWRQEVDNPWGKHPRGTIIINPDAAQLYFIESDDRAIRYGVSVGAAGFDWQGKARLQFWREWPRWNVPEAMIERQPEYEPYSVANGGMDPGPGNPLGARALYLFQNGVDTLYRIHGDADPWELGKAVSSGCIRMLNQDVIDLQDRAVHGADVIVLPSMKPSGLTEIY
ncbi:MULTISPECIES: L,D-transpeptidase [Halocynthiibacter]|uniref:L,D-transpeptidase n=1 Tax=Halocynthiibacter halioticoli TaxID=2986804 RepID=A0AAE3IXV4_9RHOB|nr:MULTISPECIES: L,D-transpeptidase [Halocynthiibacter]MCV6824118.1 L,D-transpeptidase [Halocynthiibacter halioticoli]MCW4057119.1 L,D-transpeptidase [Halocynthiibacter sp. SDUM655004]